MRFPLAILASVIAAYALSFWLTVPANPEVGFWQHVVELRDAEIAQVRKERPGQPIIFFTGGSSCAFSIDPKIIEETCGMPAFNLGLPISTGAPYIVHQALSRCQPGDVLVVCLEADALAEHGDMQSSTLAFALAVQQGDLDGTVGGSTLARSIEFSELLSLPRPGPRFLTTLAARSATGTGYRYTLDDIRYRGRIETQISDPSVAALDTPVERRIGDEASMLISQLAKAAEAKGVRLFYSMPWRYTKSDTAEEWRRANNRFLNTIDPIIPVIQDGTSGVGTERTHFSDSHQHLSAAGSEQRTSALAGTLAATLTQNSEPSHNGREN